ncbi:hypothetical protein CVD28_20490 [Bacillus sp. M6-12]|nr:hypothetical protein CVD28_20490 [Bacillus sp. M6-12]
MRNDYYWNNLFDSLPEFLIALLVLLIGWFVAKLIERGVYKALQKTKMDDRLFPGRSNRKYSSEKIISKIVYILVLAFVFILFFNILDLNFISTPLVNMLSSITAAIPNILKAALILLVGWVIASALSFLIKKAGKTLRVHQMLSKWKMTEHPQGADSLIDKTAKVVFYLVLLFFLPGVLGALNIEGISGPLEGMLHNMLTFIPKLIAAALILLVGWFIAKIARDILTGFLQSIGTDKLVQRLGFSKLFEGTSLSAAIGNLVFILILIPVVITALEKLDLEGISQPAVNMLNNIMSMIPNIIIAGILILIGLWLGKWVNNFVANFTRRLGVDSFSQGMGIKKAAASQAPLNLSKILGYVAHVIVVLLFAVEALNLVKLDFFVTLGTGVIAYLPRLLSALLIVAVGLYVGNLLKKLLGSIFQGQHFRVLAAVAKYTVIAISIFMALDQLGVADTIVNSAFILLLGGLALAFGLAFGLGGKDFAAKYLRMLDHKIEQTTIEKPYIGHNNGDQQFLNQNDQESSQQMGENPNHYNHNHPGSPQGNFFNHPNQSPGQNTDENFNKNDRNPYRDTDQFPEDGGQPPRT